MVEKGASTDVTDLLTRWRRGDDGALDTLVPLVYAELRRHADLDDALPAVEVLPEAGSVNLRVQVGVRRGDHPGVDRAAAVLANPAHLAILERTQELDLHRRRHVPELVEQQST